MLKRLAIFSILFHAYFLIMAHAVFPHVHSDDIYNTICTVNKNDHEQADLLHRIFDMILSVDTGEDHLGNYISSSATDQPGKTQLVTWVACLILSADSWQESITNKAAGLFYFDVEHELRSALLADTLGLRGPPFLI